MKTHKNLFQEVCGLKNLHKAYLKARKGKSNIEEVARFTYKLEPELLALQKELKEGIYQEGKYRNFIIYEPKERLISALPFRDRVVHHAIYNVIEPIFDRSFIYDSYACRTGKGTHRGVDRVQIFLKKFKNSYCLKCDISKYFLSVDHEVLKSAICKKIRDDKLIKLLNKIIDSVPEGIPIGNLTSQLFANIFLNQLDYFVKQELKVKYYIRYMDDFIILHESKQELHKIKLEIKIHLKKIKLKMHTKKNNIFPTNLGIDFLGYRIFNNYRLARKSTIKRFLFQIKIKIRKYNLNEIEFKKLMESFNSWYAYLNHGDTYNLKKDLFKRYFKNVM